MLPLAPDARIAVLGPAADDVRLLQGDYSYPAHTEIMQPRDEHGKLIDATGRFGAGPYYPESVTPLAGMRARARDVEYAKGCGIRSGRTDGIADAVALARSADVAVCFVGGRSGLMPNCTSGEFRDASALGLPGRPDGIGPERAHDEFPCGAADPHRVRAPGNAITSGMPLAGQFERWLPANRDTVDPRRLAATIRRDSEGFVALCA